MYIYLLSNGYSYEKTVATIFTAMVATQGVNGIHAQKEDEPFFKNPKRSLTINPFIWFGVFAGIILQLLAVYWLQDLFHTVSLGFNEIILVFICVLSFFFVIELRKWYKYFFIG